VPQRCPPPHCGQWAMCNERWAISVPHCGCLPSAFCLLPSAFCLLTSAFCLLPSALALKPHRQGHKGREGRCETASPRRSRRTRRNPNNSSSSATHYALPITRYALRVTASNVPHCGNSAFLLPPSFLKSMPPALREFRLSPFAFRLPPWPIALAIGL
jgi:hypothetical protein